MFPFFDLVLLVLLCCNLFYHISDYLQGTFPSIVSVDYGLVVLCSLEYEDRAYIVAALDQYRLSTAPDCPKLKDLQEYLKRQFHAPAKLHVKFGDDALDWVPAAKVDAER